MPSIRGIALRLSNVNPWRRGLYGSTPGSVGRIVGCNSPRSPCPTLVLVLKLLSCSSVVHKVGIRFWFMSGVGTSSTILGSLFRAPTWSMRQSSCPVIVRHIVAQVLHNCLIDWHSQHLVLAHSGVRFLSRFPIDRGEFVLVMCVPMNSSAVPSMMCLVSRTKPGGYCPSLLLPICRRGSLLGGYSWCKYLFILLWAHGAR